jgi:hypothetical protein
LQLRAEIVAAQAEAAGGARQDVGSSIKRLARVATQATAASFSDIAFRARFASGEIELRTGDAKAGSAGLQKLADDSSKAGFLLVARRATAALQAGSGQSASASGH